MADTMRPTPTTRAVTHPWVCAVLVLLTAGVNLSAAAEDTVTYTEAGVLVSRSQPEAEHHRVRREVTRSMTGFNSAEKFAMLDRHNQLRSLRRASDMMYMEWDDRLEESAQRWAEKCNFEHSDSRNDLAGYQYVGENLYAGTHAFDPANVVQLWYNEVKDYNYDDQSCSAVCGHYTQVVWAASVAVGCGVKYCPQLRNAATFNSGYHVVCHYGPGGNYIGQKPYGGGPICSRCPEDTPHCIFHLCSKYPMIGSGSEHTRHSTSLMVAAVTLATLLTSTAAR